MASFRGILNIQSLNELTPRSGRSRRRSVWAFQGPLRSRARHTREACVGGAHEASSASPHNMIEDATLEVIDMTFPPPGLSRAVDERKSGLRGGGSFAGRKSLRTMKYPNRLHWLRWRHTFLYYHPAHSGMSSYRVTGDSIASAGPSLPGTTSAIVFPLPSSASSAPAARSPWIMRVPSAICFSESSTGGSPGRWSESDEKLKSQSKWYLPFRSPDGDSSSSPEAPRS